MKRAALASLIAALLPLSVVSPASALDKPALELHIRKALNLDTRSPIKIVTDPKPAPFGNLNVITVEVGGSKVPVYITKDEKRYFWGYVFDATQDPDKERAAQISLKNVRADGSASAPVTVVEYSDMECEHCRHAHEILKAELRKAYGPDQVRLVFKHFPLQRHAWSEPAAEAAECAAEQNEGAFFKMVDAFFKNAKTTTPDNVDERARAYAKEAGLSLDRFEACRKSDRTLEKIRADKREGGAVGVGSTPTFVINGRLRRGLSGFDDLRVVIEEKLAEAKKR